MKHNYTDITLVFGHKSPDTDSMGSAIVWDWYMNECLSQPAKAVLLGQVNNEAAFVANHWGLEMPPIIEDIADGQPCVIVDTNNTAELPDNIEQANIRQIIDHHLLAGGLKTAQPIDITIRALACTATVMAELMGDTIAKAPNAIKGLMLSCILSDTLAFNSPTTTKTDKRIATELAASLEVNIDELAQAMFAAKSDISNYSDHELLRLDSKIYELSGKKLRISVLETAAPQLVMNRRDAMIAAMPTVAAEDGVEAILIFIVDILKNGATLLVPDALTAEIARQSFDAPLENGHVYLPGIVSRKKQIIPALKL